VGAYAAVPNAVADALRPLGIAVTSLPVSPQRVWELIQSGVTPLRACLQIQLSWLRVFTSANTAHLGHNGGQER